MANPSVAEIQVGRGVATGALSWGPTGTTLPTDSTTALNAAIHGLGYIGEDGIQVSRDVSTDDVKDMNGDPVYSLQTDFVLTVQAELLQSTNIDVVNMIFGDANVTPAAGSPTVGATVHIVDKGDPAAHGVLVADTFDGPKKHRETFGDAQPTEVEIGPLVGTGVRSYTVTWKVYPDASGDFRHIYEDDGVLVP